jgi:hypothetical protein
MIDGRVAWYCTYAKPAIVAPPKRAGILANFRSSLGSIRAKEAFRTATTLEKGVYPAGHIRLRAARTAKSDLRRPPAEEVVW